MMMRRRRPPSRSRHQTMMRSSAGYIERSAKSSAKPTRRILKTQRRIVDLLQVLILTRPNLARVVEDILEGMLSEQRHDDESENDNGD